MDQKHLAELYLDQKLSMQQIADREKCSMNKIVYWLKKYQIPSRPRNEAIYLKLNPDGDPFKLSELKTKEDYLLLGLGLGLFWGEGSKRHQSVIRLGNSDPRLIRKFLDFLIKVFGINLDRIKLGLQIFDDQSPEEVKSRWSKALGLEESHFLPSVVVTPKRGKGTYKILSKWGVLTIYFSNVKLRKILDQYMDKFAY